MAANTTHSNNTMKTRIQLKSDTEANWNKAGPKENSLGFIPLKGELIIYLPDNQHNYSRLKVGDGDTNVVNLPFIDSGTVNGSIISNEIIYFNGGLPLTGDSTKLYVATDTNAIYFYNGSNFVKLSNYIYTFSTSSASTISNWSAGRQPTFTVTGGTFSILTGERPTLSYVNSAFIKSVTKEGDN